MIRQIVQTIQEAQTPEIHLSWENDKAEKESSDIVNKMIKTAEANAKKGLETKIFIYNKKSDTSIGTISYMYHQDTIGIKYKDKTSPEWLFLGAYQGNHHSISQKQVREKFKVHNIIKFRVITRPLELPKTDVKSENFSNKETRIKNFLETSYKDIPAENKNGTCFKDSFNYLEVFSSFKLVHGLVTGQGPIEGIIYNHAWIEDGNFVIDPSLKKAGRKVYKFDKELYYAIGNIQGKNTFSYSYEEASKKLSELKNYGPWEKVLMKNKY